MLHETHYADNGAAFRESEQRRQCQYRVSGRGRGAIRSRLRPRLHFSSRLTTVMFTDIVGSTEQAAAMGDSRWRELMSHHDALVHVELERYRGRAVKSMGDGFLATFDGPARGIRCARAIQEAARAFHLEIRAGLHTGECELLDNDIGGLAVHIGARIAALANADEVLVSRTVKDLVIGSGIMFIDRGSKELKGVPGRWNLFAVDSVEEPASDHVVPDARERRPQDRTTARAARRSPKLVGRIIGFGSRRNPQDSRR